MQYDGECLNGIINGKGKLYDRGQLIFEGEFVNEKKNGKGIEYDGLGSILFEGEYRNDRKWNGKEKTIQVE